MTPGRRFYYAMKGVKNMENEKMIEIAIQSLRSFDANSIETVQLNRTQYDDGSTGYTIDITFPATEGEQSHSERK